MKRTRLFWAAMLVLASLAILAPAQAQSSTPVQVITGEITGEAERVYYTVAGMEAGDTLYVSLEAESGDLDPYLVLASGGFEHIITEDDNSGGRGDAALHHEIAAGEETLGLVVTRQGGAGEYRLVVGVNNPMILSGLAIPTGDEFVFPAEPPAEGLAIGQGATNCVSFEDYGRPRLSGTELRRETEHFIVHYTDQGRDGATPYMVGQIIETLDRVWAVEVETVGWPAPPTDCGEGGDTRYDVYLAEVMSEGILGYASPEGLVGDNPNSPELETYAVYSFLVMDNDFMYQGRGPFMETMRTTAAHEFNHSIQFGYDLNDVGGHWYYEATASWTETQAFPDEEEATPYVEYLFNSPDLCIGAEPTAADNELRIYGEWLLIDSLYQDYGPQAIPRLWQIIADQEAMQSFYDLAAELGTTPDEILERYAVRNLLRRYDLASRFDAQVRVEANVNRPGEVTPRRDGVQQLGADYLLIANRGNYTFSVDQSNLRLVVVGIDLPTRQARVFDLGQRGTVDTSAFSNAYVIILNTTQHAANFECAFTDWTLTVEAAGDAAPTPPDDEVWDASHFVPAG